MQAVTLTMSPSEETFFCCICSLEHNIVIAPTNGYANAKPLRNVMKTICKYLLIPQEDINDIISSSSGSFFCPACLVAAEEVIEIERKVEVLELQIQYKVDCLGKTVVGTPEKVLRKRVQKVGQGSTILRKFTRPVINNYLQGFLPNPSVLLQQLQISLSTNTDAVGTAIETPNLADDDVPTLLELEKLDKAEVERELITNADADADPESEDEVDRDLKMENGMPLLSKQDTLEDRPVLDAEEDEEAEDNLDSAGRDFSDINSSGEEGMPSLLNPDGFEISSFLLEDMESQDLFCDNENNGLNDVMIKSIVSLRDMNHYPVEASERSTIRDANDDPVVASVLIPQSGIPLKSVGGNSGTCFANPGTHEPMPNGPNDDPIDLKYHVNDSQALESYYFAGDGGQMTCRFCGYAVTPGAGMNAKAIESTLLVHINVDHFEETLNVEPLRESIIVNTLESPSENEDPMPIKTPRRIQPHRKSAPKKFKFDDQEERDTWRRSRSRTQSKLVENDDSSFITTKSRRHFAQDSLDVEEEQLRAQTENTTPNINSKADPNILNPLPMNLKLTKPNNMERIAAEKKYYKCHKCDFTTNVKCTTATSKQKICAFQKLDIHYNNQHNPVAFDEISKTIDGRDCYQCKKCYFASEIKYPNRKGSSRKPLYSARLRLSKHYRRIHPDHECVVKFEVPEAINLIQPNQPIYASKSTNSIVSMILNPLSAMAAPINRQRNCNKIPNLAVQSKSNVKAVRTSKVKPNEPSEIRIILNKDGNDCFQCRSCYFHVKIDYSSGNLPFKCREDAYKAVYEHFNMTHATLLINPYVPVHETSTPAQSIPKESKSSKSAQGKESKKLKCSKCDYFVKVKFAKGKSRKRCRGIAHGTLVHHLSTVHSGKLSELDEQKVQVVEVTTNDCLKCQRCDYIVKIKPATAKKRPQKRRRDAECKLNLHIASIHIFGADGKNIGPEASAPESSSKRRKRLRMANSESLDPDWGPSSATAINPTRQSRSYRITNFTPSNQSNQEEVRLQEDLPNVSSLVNWMVHQTSPIIQL